MGRDIFHSKPWTFPGISNLWDLRLPVMGLGGEMNYWEKIPFFSLLSCHSCFLLYQSTRLSLFCLSNIYSFNFGINGWLGDVSDLLRVILAVTPLGGSLPLNTNLQIFQIFPFFQLSLLPFPPRALKISLELFPGGENSCIQSGCLHFPTENCSKFSGISTLNFHGLFSASMRFWGGITQGYGNYWIEGGLQMILLLIIKFHPSPN